MDPFKRIGDVTIERVNLDSNIKHDTTAMNYESGSDSENPLSEDELNSEEKSISSAISDQNIIVSKSIKRKNEFETSNESSKKTKSDSDSEQMIVNTDLNKTSENLNDELVSRTILSDNEDSEYDTEEESDTEEQNLKQEETKSVIEAENTDFIEKLTNELGESSSQKSEDLKLDNSDYDYDITEKLKEMGEISVETVKKGEKTRKTESSDDVENEISVTPAKKSEEDDDKLSAEKKIGNMRRNIREVMDETQLDEATLAAQRQEMERLRRVQEQQRIIREVQRQIALNRQNNKTQHRVISLLQGNSTLVKQIPGTSKTESSSSFGSPSGSTSFGQGTGTASGAPVNNKIGGTVLVKLPNGETKSMTRITKSGAPFEVVRLQKGALQSKVQRNLIPIKKTTSGNLTPSVSIAPVSKKLEPKIESDSDSEFSDSEKKVRKVAGKPKDVVTISSSSDDDCIVLSEDEPEDTETEEDPCNSGMHTNDSYNVPDEEGRVLINVGHPENEADIYLAPQIARVIKPHQIGGVRFLFDNVIESIERFNTSTGFGCILAHSMGLGKTLQIVCFSDIFLRYTDAKTILCIMPINTLQNWLAEYNMWLPKDPTNSPLLSHGEVRPRNFNLFVLNDSHKTLAARAKVIQEWHKDGGVLLIGYELYRLLSLRRNPKSKKKKKPAGNAPERPETPEDEDKNKSLFEEIHEALVKPGPDLVICDEGHRIKNSHASISQALKQIRSKRRIVLTGYPLQNNLLEYWCMVDFVRPNYLGTKTEFSNMFERPIQNGQCIDSTPQDIRLMRYRAHVLHSLLEGFVQRRSHAVLQTSLPQKEEYVLLVRMNEFQRKLYDTFMNEVVRTKTVPNPLKAFAVCCKIWNHPDVLYYFLKKQTAGEAVDLDLEEVAGAAATPTTTTPKKGSARSKGGSKKEKKTASKSTNSSTKPAASVTPNTSVTNTVSTTSSTTTNPQNVPNHPQMPQYPQNNNQTVSPQQMNNVPINTVQNPPNYNQMNSNYNNSYPYPQNYNQYQQNGDFYNQNQNYPNNYNQNYYPNQDYGGFYPENKPDYGYQHNQNYWQNDQQNNQFYQSNGPQNDYYSNMNPQQQYNNQDYYRQNSYNQNFPSNNVYQQNNPPFPQNQGWNPQNPPQADIKPPYNPPPNFPSLESKPDVKMDNCDQSTSKADMERKDVKPEENKPVGTNMEDDKNIETAGLETGNKEENDEKEREVDIKNAELTAAALAKKEDPGIPYDWAHELMKGYIPGCIENSAKMEVFFCILQESMALGDRILLFSQSLFTLNLIEEFLQKNEVPGSSDKWTKSKHYYRLDGSTSALEREKLINEYNSNPNIHLFLVSTRAGSLGINLVGANRVIVFDASWNPCHDTQAVCRVYRYGQKKPCFVYRIVMDNCLEKKIYDRQINKQGMADRVVDECNPDAHLSMKDVTNLCWDDEKDSEVKDFSTNKDKYIDVVMQKVLDAFSHRLSKEPFQHESLLIDRKEKKLSQAEKRLAKRSYELEKQANINSRPTYSYYNNGSGQGLQIRAIRSADGSVLQNKPVASVRPMQSEQLVRDLGRPGGAGSQGRSRWIPAEVWQRQGMTAQEMTLPLDVVIPTNSPDRGSIVLKAGQKVLVLKSPKGIYMQLECGKIVAIKTAFKVRGGKAPEKSGDEGGKESPTVPTTILKKVPQGANTSKNTGNVPLPLKNNTAITVIPKSGQQRLVKPFTQGVKLNMRSVRQPVPNLVGRQVPMRVGGPRFTGKIQSIHRKVQLARAKPYNLDKIDSNPIDPSKIKTEPLENEGETHVVPSSDEEIPLDDKKISSPEPSFSESEKSVENLDYTEISEQGDDRRSSIDERQADHSKRNEVYSNFSEPKMNEVYPNFTDHPKTNETYSSFSEPKTNEVYSNFSEPKSTETFQSFPEPKSTETYQSFPEPKSTETYQRFPERKQTESYSNFSEPKTNETYPKIPAVTETYPNFPEQLSIIKEKPKTVPAFQVQNPPNPIPSPAVQESPTSNRSLKNYRHNFAGQKASKMQLKAPTTSSALHQLEQTTSAIGENKQPFQESLDNITNSYGTGISGEKTHEETTSVIDLEEKGDVEVAEKSVKFNTPSKPISHSIVLPQKPEQSPPLSVPPPPPTSVGHHTGSQHPPHPSQNPPPLQPNQPPVGLIPHPNHNVQQQDFTPHVGGNYGTYYGYGAPPYPPPPQAYYPNPEMGPYVNGKPREKEKGQSSALQNTSLRPEGLPPATADASTVSTSIQPVGREPSVSSSAPPLAPLPALNNAPPSLNNVPPLNNVPTSLNNAPAPLNNAPPPLNNTLPPSNNAPPPLNNPVPLLNNVPPPLNNAPASLNNVPPPLNNAPPPLNSAPPPVSTGPPGPPISSIPTSVPAPEQSYNSNAAPTISGTPVAPPAGGPGGFTSYGQPAIPPPPHGGYDMVYGQQQQYAGPNYPGLPYPNQPNYQPPYQQYDQSYTPTAPNMYSAFHRPELHHQYPADPYQYSHVRNYPPQYGYPPPGAPNQYPVAPSGGYDYQYNTGGFPPPPPPFVGPYTGLPNNNAVP